MQPTAETMLNKAYADILPKIPSSCFVPLLFFSLKCLCPLSRVFCWSVFHKWPFLRKWPIGTPSDEILMTITNLNTLEDRLNNIRLAQKRLEKEVWNPCDGSPDNKSRALKTLQRRQKKARKLVFSSFEDLSNRLYRNLVAVS